jgi:capsule polysaccharide export protein KpsE/RkpR
MDKAAMASSEIPPKRLKDWQLEDKLDALHKTYGLVGEELNAWCREQGVFVHQLAQWKADFCRQSSELTKREEAREVQGLKTEIQSLERELLRKDRALAEAAALLVLQKKFRALLGGEEK